MAFTLTSWNVLADSYVRREYYPHTAIEILRPTDRRRVLLAWIERFDTDLLCLQEVEQDAFRDFRRTLEPTFRSRFLRKSLGKPDGCVTFWRGFELDAAEELRYSDGSGHVALIVRLTRGERTVTVANTHLKWSPPEERVGLTQMEELVKNLPEESRIICGDLNVTPDSDVVRLLHEQGMSCVHPDEAFTCNSNGKAKKIDFIFHDPSLTSRPFPMQAIEDQTPLPSAECPSDHLPIQAEFREST